MTGDDWMEAIKGMQCNTPDCNHIFGDDAVGSSKKAYVCPAFKHAGNARDSCGHIKCQMCHSFHLLHLPESEVLYGDVYKLGIVEIVI